MAAELDYEIWMSQLLPFGGLSKEDGDEKPNN